SEADRSATGPDSDRVGTTGRAGATSAPPRAIQAAISARDRTPSLLRICSTWPSAVRSAMNRRAAISRLVRPSETRKATSLSRLDRRTPNVATSREYHAPFQQPVSPRPEATSDHFGTSNRRHKALPLRQSGTKTGIAPGSSPDVVRSAALDDGGVESTQTEVNRNASTFDVHEIPADVCRLVLRRRRRPAFGRNSGVRAQTDDRHTECASDHRRGARASGGPRLRLGQQPERLLTERPARRSNALTIAAR